MRIALFLWLILIVVCSTVFPSAAVAELPLGPAYPDQLPRLEVVLEPRSADRLTDLRPEQLQLVEDGIATVVADGIQPFRETGRGLAMVVAIDASGTMAGAPLQTIKSALDDLVAQVRPQDRLAIITFADDVGIAVGFSNDAGALRAAIRGLESRGHTTELHMALFKALGMLEIAGLPPRRRLVVISDGKDEGTAYRLEDVIERASKLHIPVDSIGLTRIDPRHLRQLERLSDLTNGSFARVTDTAEIETRVTQWSEALLSSPVALFRAQNLTRDAKAHRIGVRWNRQGQILRGEVDVAAPGPSSLPGSAEDPSEPGPNGQSQDAGSRGDTFFRGPALLFIGLALLALLLLIVLLRNRAKASGVGQKAGRLQPTVGSSTATVVETPAVQPAPERAQSVDVRARSAAEPPAARSVLGSRRTQHRIPFPAPSEDRPAALLRPVGEALGGQSFAIANDTFWIGTDSANQLALEDGFASGNHACIRFHEGSLLLYDNASTNGTFLNDERLADLPRPLALGDVIRCGHTRLTVLAAATDPGARK
ncbi:MAG: VWA domain-containing protein [Thermoanaerobaculia bacterium]|nr:VWA domain-containing protein [Thermoanaerobaculia bacterium]